MDVVGVAALEEDDPPDVPPVAVALGAAPLTVVPVAYAPALPDMLL